MKKTIQLSIAFLFFSLFLVNTANADLCDDLSTTANFDPGFNGTTVSSDGNFATVTRGDDTVDSGIDWRPSGTGFLSYDSMSVLTISPFDDLSNNAQYDVNILYFDSNDNFIAGSETNWLSTTSSDSQTVDVRTLFSDPNVDSFYVRIRVIGATGTTKTLDKISAVAAVPEPSSVFGLALVLGVVGVRRRRV